MCHSVNGPGYFDTPSKKDVPWVQSPTPALASKRRCRYSDVLRLFTAKGKVVEAVRSPGGDRRFFVHAIMVTWLGSFFGSSWGQHSRSTRFLRFVWAHTHVELTWEQQIEKRIIPSVGEFVGTGLFRDMEELSSAAVISGTTLILNSDIECLFETRCVFRCVALD